MSRKTPAASDPSSGLRIVNGEVHATDVQRRLRLTAQEFRDLLGDIGLLPLEGFEDVRTPRWLPVEVAAQLIDEADADERRRVQS